MSEMEERIEYLWQKARRLRDRADALDVERWKLEDMFELLNDQPVPFDTGRVYRAMQIVRAQASPMERPWYVGRIWNNQEDR